MKTHTVRPQVSVAVLMLALLVELFSARFAAAQTRDLWVIVKVADNVLVDTPVMVSAIRDGEVVGQDEELLVRAPNAVSVKAGELPPGLYDVRIEGAGFVTEVKRGVHLFADRNAQLTAVVRPGEGVHIVEYATGGLAREEVAARLAKLEADVAQLQQAVARQ